MNFKGVYVDNKRLEVRKNVFVSWRLKTFQPPLVGHCPQRLMSPPSPHQHLTHVSVPQKLISPSLHYITVLYIPVGRNWPTVESQLDQQSSEPIIVQFYGQMRDMQKEIADLIPMHNRMLESLL